MASSCIVFEAINDDRKEIFVGLSPLPMHEAIQAFRACPPSPARHWTGPEKWHFRSVEFGLTEAQAQDFIRQYAKRSLPPWRYLADLAPSAKRRATA